MSSGLLAPVIITGLNDGGNIVISWVRCSRIPGIEQDNWSSQYFEAPLDSIDERYEVDVISPSGSVVRTLYAIGSPTANYTVANQTADFGTVQSTYTINVYQTDQILGRGSYRQAVLNVASLKNLKHYNNMVIELDVTISMSASFAIVHGVYPIPFIFGGAPISSAPLGGSL